MTTTERGIRVFVDLAEARRQLIERTPMEAVALPESVRARIREQWGEELSADEVVDRILTAVRVDGDHALIDLARRIDGVALSSLEVGRDEIERAYAALDAAVVEALRFAAARVRAFHERQRRNSWIDFEEGYGQLIRPLDRVGIYVPGGTAAYPSTVIMSAVPARVAGVREVVLTSPCGRDGSLPATTLVAADIAGVDRIFRVGGAQAIGALAFGTESVPRVDKILGPGNLFVTLAKRKVYGLVAIDALAGPTETMIIADGHADPSLCAADLLAQAEHDILAQPILLTDSRVLAEQTAKEIERQLPQLDRAPIARAAVADRGGIVVTPDLATAFALMNEYGPEHLCLHLRDPWQWLPAVKNAGGVFVGEHSTEALGDYVVGPSHVMPTGGTARFNSPLTVDDFVKLISVIALSKEKMAALIPATATLARAEGLTAHARSVEIRAEREA
ncbi:MAG: histidinol dehydrogenase [Chloroflexota bacterium]|nr:histidinol dehydrogenase [Dehalococcoidia bacterium]MDW8253957.1 histidinol dehydrogenase [Chloroflexota bacterium]